MKLDGPQFFDINVLKGALVTSPNDGNESYVTGISVDIAKHEIFIDLKGTGRDGFDSTCSLEWSTLKDWSIQFQGGK